MSLPTSAELAHAMLEQNPFRYNRVSAPDDVTVDVSAIHDVEFRKLLRAFKTVRTDRKSIGAALLGPSGVGKSHLLSRLHAWAQKEPSASYVFLHNLQVSAARMPRYLLKAALRGICSYRRGTYNTANLYMFLLTALPQQTADFELPLWHLSRPDPEDLPIHGALAAFMSLLSTCEDPESHRLAAAAVDWLSGEQIGTEDAATLSRISGQRIGNALVDNHAVERAFITLADLLMAAGQTLILCLDQIDNLDTDQVRSLSSFLHALIDHSSNLIVICSGVTTSMDNLREQGVIPEAAWDRLGEERIDLLEIRTHDALRIIQDRLNSFFAPYAHLKELTGARNRDALFPLGTAWWQDRTRDLLQVRPRDAITWAKNAWQMQQDALETRGLSYMLGTTATPRSNGRSPRSDAARLPSHSPSEKRAAPQEALDRFVQVRLRELIRHRLDNPTSLPPDSDNLATLTRLLLNRCIAHPGGDSHGLVSVEQSADTPRKPKRYDLHLTHRSPEGDIQHSRVLFLTTAVGNGVTAALSRLLNDVKEPGRIWLITDKRQPLKLGLRGAEHLSALQRKGQPRFQHLRVAFETHAELDALADLLSQAKVADLELSDDDTQYAVSEQDLMASYGRLARIANNPLLRALLYAENAPTSERAGRTASPAP